jgi:transcriptional regulator GlxA family with amidase domain
LFTRSVGESPYSYYLTNLLERAAGRLATTDDPVKEIAIDLGFNSFSHFSNAFRQRWNMTPTAFRQNASRIDQPDAARIALP